MTLVGNWPKKIKKENNAYFVEDGSVWTNTHVCKGQEIMYAYKHEQILTHSLMAGAWNEANWPPGPKEDSGNSEDESDIERKPAAKKRVRSATCQEI